MCAQEEAAAGESFDDHKYPVFRLFLRLYYYSSVHNTFVAVPAMPWVIPGKIRDALACLRSINQGMIFSSVPKRLLRCH